MENNQKKVFDFVSKKKVFFAIPIIIAVVTLIFTFIFGLEVAIEFKGGTILTYSYTGEIDLKEVKSTVEGMKYGAVTVTSGSSMNSADETISVSFASDNGLTAEVQSEITDKLIDEFKDNKLSILQSQDVNPSTGGTFFLKCFVAVGFSFILLVIYIAFRFKKIGGWSAGVFALVALLHDVFIVYASFVFLRMEINANFMAVILTILGYSINNTIVIYDRIRENRTICGKTTSFKELVNLSISQTLTRSINTTITTAGAVIVICIVSMVCGVESIISFAFPMLIGLLAGFYSSVFLAGSLWVTWKEHKEKKKDQKKTVAKKATA